MAISGFISVPEWGRGSEREGGGAYPARLCPHDAEEVVGKTRRHIWSALPGTKNHPIVPAWQISKCVVLLLSHPPCVDLCTVCLSHPPCVDLCTVCLSHPPCVDLCTVCLSHPPCVDLCTVCFVSLHFFSSHLNLSTVCTFTLSFYFKLHDSPAAIVIIVCVM